MKCLLACLLMTCVLYAQGQLTSSDLPVVVINTGGQPIPDDPKIMAEMGIIWNGDGNRNQLTDAFNHYLGFIGIEVRGQSSQQFPMKSYSIELRDSSGESINRSLFGMPAESDWVLYAPYNDKTLQHNFLAYTLSRELGNWAARCRYVELVLNGDYRGIYVLMERIKRKNGRVNIASMGSADNSGDPVTGGFIISIDKEANAWFSAYPAGRSRIQFSYVYPKPENITPAQQGYIRRYTDSFEQALYSADYQHPQRGWRAFADPASFIDFFLINELSRNVDGYRLSSYFHKDRQSRGGLLKAGPVWDFDLAFRNANYCSGSEVEGWSYRFNTVCPDDYWQVPFWWDRLLADSGFKNSLRCRWQDVRRSSFSESRLYRIIDSVAALTAEARQRHFSRWPVLGQYVWPNPSPIPADYAGEISTLKTWLAQRLQWLDSNIPNTGGCAVYPAELTSSFLLKAFPNPAGSAPVILQSRLPQRILVQVYDMAGRLLYRAEQSASAGMNYWWLPVNQWGRGLCTVLFSNSAGEQISRRLLVR